MAVSGRCSGGRGVCQPLATWGCDGHAVNDTTLAHGQLLVDDPERIGPIQATGMDQTLFNREYRTQQWTTTFDSPLKSEGPHMGVTDVGMPLIEPGHPLRMSVTGCSAGEPSIRSGLISLVNSSPDVAAEATRGFAHGCVRHNRVIGRSADSVETRSR